jgi:hypothetical protein
MKHTGEPKHQHICAAILRLVHKMWFVWVEDAILKVTGDTPLLLTALVLDRRVEWQSVIRGDCGYFAITERTVLKPLEWEEGEARYKAANSWQSLALGEIDSDDMLDG